MCVDQLQDHPGLAYQSTRRVDGGDGSDTAVYCLPQASYTVETTGDTTTITGPDGTDTLSNIESIAFTDASIDLG